MDNQPVLQLNCVQWATVKSRIDSYQSSDSVQEAVLALSTGCDRDLKCTPKRCAVQQQI